MRLSEEVRIGLRLSFLIGAAAMGLCLILSIGLGLLDPDLRAFTRATSWLSHHPTGQHCLLCGMTHSFCAMSRGRWADAWQFNPLGPPLYSTFWICSGVGLGMVLRRLSRRRPERAEA